MQERIIQFLKEADGYVSGEEMSQQLSMSRAAIWKHMQELRSHGYEIVAVPHLGYQLLSSPDRLLPHEIHFGLKTKIMGRKVYAFESIPSTMDEAFRLGMEGAPEGTLVCAESQTQGRGRLGRVWVSPKAKGIYASLILRPSLSPSQMPPITLMAAVALAETVRRLTALKPLIKWPNDLLVSNKKLAGILTELRAETDQVRFVVLGIGLNINATSSQLLDTATSLKIETKKTFNRVEILQELLCQMEQWYGLVLKGRFSEILKYCRKHSATLKKRVRLHDASGDIQGMAVAMDDDGGLVIRLDNGHLVKKMAGDIHQLRQ